MEFIKALFNPTDKNGLSKPVPDNSNSNLCTK